MRNPAAAAPVHQPMDQLSRPGRIEDYGVIGNLHTAALVNRNGCIDWLCLPRFDSGAVFARLLGEAENGYWQVAPVGEPKSITRFYEEDTLVLVTRFETSTGVVELTDFMPIDTQPSHGRLVRIVECVEGEVEMQTVLYLRFDYGSTIPWVRSVDEGIYAISGPYSVRIRTPVPLEGKDMHTEGRFTVRKEQRIPLEMSWHMSYLEDMLPRSADHLLGKTRRYWRRWVGTCADGVGEMREAVVRSLITLKALTNTLSGGIVAAVTTSLPEWPGSVRNWDYRYCWVRDAAFTLNAFMRWGHTQEICDWRGWLLRAAAGQPADLQIMYGIAGERRLTELELPWLKGFRDSQPVRIGNAASEQRQLDVYGELADALSLGGQMGLPPSEDSWAMGKSIIQFLETIWDQPDSGLWEMRGPPQHHTYSKDMAWLAFDRAVRTATSRNLDAPVARWTKVRDRIHADVCEKGFDGTRNSFMQAYGSSKLDASLLRIPLVGFLPGDDPRVIGTVDAVQKTLVKNGMVMRYEPDSESGDGLPPGEGSFLACTFWLADALIATGRKPEARVLFDQLLAVRNDLGLLAEEYDPIAKCQLGNFPQAFSHVGLLHTARNLVDSASMGPLPR